MDFSFRTRETVRSSEDATLQTILKSCRVNATLRVHASSHGDEIELVGVDVDEVDFDPPDSVGALTARFLAHDELDRLLHAALEGEVADKWDEHYDEASRALFEEIEARREEAELRRYGL